MVLVSVYGISRDVLRSKLDRADAGEKYRLSLGVVGFVPKDPAEAIDFMTRWAETLRFDYLNAGSEELGRWGYIIAELARGKRFLGTVPWDTYHESCQKGETCYSVFVDVGSPVRHVYLVGREAYSTDREIYIIHGQGIWYVEMILVEMEFFRSSIGFTKCWSMEKDALAEDTSIHTEAYCDLDEESKKLVERIKKRHRIDERKQPAKKEG